MHWAKLRSTINFLEIDFRHTVAGLRPLKAAILSVLDITSRYTPPYHVMVSGGIDSQAMLYAWHLSGVPFTATSILYNHTLNSHDLEQLAEFSKNELISVTYSPFDLLYFLENDYHEWAQRYQCSSPQIAAHMAMGHQLPGTKIYSGNFLTTTAGMSYAQLALFRYSQENSKTVVPYFFLHTPELAYSMRPIAAQFQYRKDFYQSRVLSYQTAGFPVIPQIKKLTGFEQVKDIYDQQYSHRISAQARLQFAEKSSNRAFDILLRYPYERKFGTPLIRYLLNE